MIYSLYQTPTPMTSRRGFLKNSTALIALSPFALSTKAADLSDACRELNKRQPLDAAGDEDLWSQIANAYTVSPNMLNLNNGGVSPQPKVVQEAVNRYYQMSNEGPTYFMWQILDKGRELLRANLARLANVGADELAINRNATEALGTVTWGISMAKGDEIVMTKQDYPNMIHAWKQKELREGIRIKWISLDMPLENEDVVVNAFVGATTPRTRVWHITHMINWNGQILPVRRLCEEARKRNIISIVDGAHTFAHMDFKISDFQPDYFGTSLHKWLCAPFGTGMLYIKKDNIEKTWPLFPNDKPQSNDIRKFETIGTRSFAPEQAIGQAIAFHEMIGARHKEERLRYLKNYWCTQLAKHPRVKINVSLRPEYSCALGNFSVSDMDPEKVANRLMGEHQIHTVAIKWENIQGVRITPHVYTLTKDLDRFLDATYKVIGT